MTVWQIYTDLSDKVASLVIPEAERTAATTKRFGGDGSPLRWRKPPRLEAYSYGRKKPMPLGDIGPFLPGALVLSERARDAIGPFLSQFGQLLPLQVEGIPHWFFNVTNLVHCIDKESSEPYVPGTVDKEAFIEAALPAEPSVFKDPLTAKARIYVNDSGRRVLEDAMASARIKGLMFLRTGAERRSA